ncbi:MAG: hypothetical protein Q4F79_11965 [Eubacteriales bacterium]|nr:hypothetical protein [Eubacteriales bacterium]
MIDRFLCTGSLGVSWPTRPAIFAASIPKGKEGRETGEIVRTSRTKTWEYVFVRL